jgi:hypothetical protein
VLPLVEFRPHSSVPVETVQDLISEYPNSKILDLTLFSESINAHLSNPEVKGYTPVDVNKETLASFTREEIYAIKKNGESIFYKNIIPEIGIAVCHHCCNFFHEEEFEYEYLKANGCPFCKGQKVDGVSAMLIFILCQNAYSHQPQSMML